MFSNAKFKKPFDKKHFVEFNYIVIPKAAAFIVGSSLKVDGRWMGALDPERIRRMTETVLSMKG